MIRYSKAEEAWLRENYHAGTINDTLDAFEREFGRRPSKQALFVKCNKMGLRKDKHDNERRAPAQMRIRWSEPKFAEMREWMLEQTCQECVKAGHKAKGERRGTMAECAVCGATFKRERKNQSRCPECIEAKPKHSPERHRAYYDSHGHR